MNNCKSTDFKYLSSKANAEKKLFDKGAIDVYNKIINLEIFNDLALQFLEFVKKEFNLDPTSVISGRFGDSVIFNNDVFRKVDKVRGYDKINAENIRKQLAALEKPTQEVKPGVELVKKLQTKLQSLYPEIKLNITNNPVWEQGNNILNQEEYEKEITYRLKAVDILYSDKGTQLFEKGKKAGWSLEKTLTELQIPKEQKELILNLGKTDREEIITDLLANYSYAIEINLALTQGESKNVIDRNNSTKEEYENIPAIEIESPYNKNSIDITYYKEYNGETYTKVLTPTLMTEKGKVIEYGEEFYKTIKEIPTSYYSNLTVPGGTNGSYIEANIETPMIVPSIQSHAKFKTDNTIGWMRADERQNYQEKDIDNLIEIMKKSGILEVNCG